MLGGAKRRLDRLARGSSGQALVEFAIVAPLIVMILLFAIWFYELIHIKLKVQEATRYAAWEATAYPLHDYAEGPDANDQLKQDALTQIRDDTLQRYADLDSSTQNQDLNTQIFAASFVQPLVLMTSRQEEPVPGGTVVNFIFGIVGTLFDFFSGLNYSSTNPVATALVGVGKDKGGAMMTRMFGNDQWGFNKEGYICSSVTVLVRNEWFNRGVGRFILPNFGVLLKEQPKRMWDHCVLADSWRLNNGEAVGQSGTQRPGVSEDTGFWKQVDRMYFMNTGARKVADGFITTFREGINFVLRAGGVNIGNPPNLEERDWLQAAVVSLPYGGGQQNGEGQEGGNASPETTGQIQINQDRGATNRYDTAPVGKGQTGESLKPYYETLKQRGPYFMGCNTNMSLGCPTSTLQQDNPFGDYIWRGEEGGGNP